MPLTVAALLAGVLGRFSTQAYDYAGSYALYQGLVGGPNMFGSMLAMCSPYLLWKVYHYWGSIRLRMVWLLLAFTGLYYLVAASSRSAMMAVIITTTGMFLSLGVRKRVQIFVLTVGALGVLVTTLPDQFEALQQKLIYKHATQAQGGVFYTRLDPWRISLQKATEGGWFGGGYGVSIGDKTPFELSLTVHKYGREKGNSQLAIIEETGLVGLVLYLTSLIFLSLRLVKAVRRWPSGPGKVMMSITTSLLAGMLFGSCFEAWWVAPGAPETVYFWVMTGVALGLSATRPVNAKEQVMLMHMQRPIFTESHGQNPTAV